MLFLGTKGGSTLRMEEQGDLHGGEEGTEVSEGFPQYRPVFPTPAPCVRAPWRQMAAYPRMQVSCGGKGMTCVLPGRERVPGPRESRRENPQPWPQWLQWPPQAPAMGPGPAHQGPGSPQVNAFCGHQGQEAYDAFTERAGTSAGGPGSGRSQCILP